MKWFKHESRAHRDKKLQKLIMKYGFEGYGLYWYCIEGACLNLDPSLTFEVETDSEILAHVGSMDSRKVEEIMIYMVSLELFEASDNLITCLKLARFLGESGTRNTELKRVIRSEKDKVKELGVSDSLRQSQTVSDCLTKRREEKRREDNNKTLTVARSVVDDLFEQFYEAYPKKQGRIAAQKAWNKLKPDQSLTNQLIADIQARIDQGAWCTTGPDRNYIPGPAPYLNQRKWEDEIIPRPEFKKPVDFSAIAREAQEL